MKKKVWKFKLAEEFSTDLKRFGQNIPDFSFYDKIEGSWQLVGGTKDGILTIRKGYKWDGNTPKIRLFGKIVGIPDFPETWEASLVHDFLLEYFCQHTIPRKIIDGLFGSILAEKRFQFVWLYSTGVNLFGPVSVKLWPCK